MTDQSVDLVGYSASNFAGAANAPLVNSQTVEENEGLHPHIRWTKTPDFVHVYRGILPMNRVFFLTAALCLVRHTQARRVFQRGQ